MVLLVSGELWFGLENSLWLFHSLHDLLFSSFGCPAVDVIMANSKPCGKRSPSVLLCVKVTTKTRQVQVLINIKTSALLYEQLRSFTLRSQ